MNSLTAYDSDSSGGPDDAPAVASSSSQILTKRIKVDAAPDVNTEDLSEYRYLPGVKTKEIMHNVPFADLAKPLVGPSNPFQQEAMNKNILTGFVEEHNMSEFAFSTMERTYLNFGYTVNPNSQHELIGNADKIAEYGGANIHERSTKHDVKRKRKPKGDPSVVGGYQGPWAGYADEDEERGLSGPTEEEKAALEKALNNTPAAVIKAQEVVADPGKEKTVFHGKAEFDYLGRTYMHAPTDLEGVNLNGEPGSQECFIPKTLVHTWSGHTKGVNQIQFLPKTAHLLLSASMDSKVKIWDVYNDRRCLRTYMGHSKAVKAIDFSNDGKRFLSCSYDKWIKLWDTETGQCIRSFSTKRIPNCVTFNPSGDKQNIFLTGCADKKVYQFDTNSGKVVQEYDQHLGAVNTVTFVDNNRRFVTTSDDKTMRAWEYGIPVVIKYIAEPDMHSMPAVTLHPSQKWLACQSLDNQILIYSASDRFKLQRKKVFKGHLVAGYACKPGFSADGRFIMSGDSEGKVWFWDWKTCKVYKKFKAHDGVVMDCQWHPHEASRVATCSWDGTIKKMGRTNPLALRLRGLVNWPSNVRHPLLSSYIKHIFQDALVAEPGIRASTTGLWVNVTVYSDSHTQLMQHPKISGSVSDRAVNFSSVKVLEALGRGEKRISELSGSASKNEYHKSLFASVPATKMIKERTASEYTGTSPLLARAEKEGVLEALQVYRNVPIHLQVNVIRNPILNAEILAQYVAGQLEAGKQLPRVYKQVLGKLTA
ncbi:hypothetical protein HDU98_006972 [Podochytrium sp. JEL0797]|nr:hypothetical protein HDU98_006972 [Podochytrium sp. JEL0797]